MTDPSQDAPFRARQEVLNLLPERSGNHINGLGEAEKRNASPVMWHDPDILAHGDLQNWFFANGTAPGANMHRAANQEFMSKPMPDLASEAADWTPDAAAAKVKAAALELESDIVGIVRLNQDWVFDGYEANYQWIIVLGVAMDWDCLKTAPSEKSQTEVQNQYGRGTRAAYKLAGWLRGHGWDAHPHGGPIAGPVLMIPAAIEAGFGELGKHGSIISKEHGSTLRLGAVATEMPLKIDGPKDHGVDKVCQSCQICTRFCPGEAISPEKYDFHGIPRWRINTPKCEPFLFKLFGCKICMMVCPFGSRGKFKEDYKNTAKSIREAKTREGLLDKIVEQSGIDFEKLNVPVVEHYPDGWDSEK